MNMVTAMTMTNDSTKTNLKALLPRHAVMKDFQKFLKEHTEGVVTSVGTGDTRALGPLSAVLGTVDSVEPSLVVYLSEMKLTWRFFRWRGLMDSSEFLP